MRVRVAVVLVGMFALACGKTKITGGGGSCGDSTVCVEGAVCVDNVCRVLCNDQTQCGSGQACDQGVCVPVAVVPPIINTIDGSGSVDGRSGYTARRLRDRVVIDGEHLSGAEFRLTGVNPVTPMVVLAACATGSDTHAEMALPLGVATGDYLLTAVNQAGQCDSSLRLIQGEPGSLTASGSEIVASINTALAADPTLQVRGALAGQVTTLVAMAAAGNATLRSVVVNGVDQVNDAAAGLFLVVFDVNTHQVVDQQATTLFRTRQNFAAGAQLQQDGLRDVLATLTDEHLVVLVSTGDISAMAADTQLAAQLKQFGASAAFESVTAGQSYVLFGMRNLGEGQGVEQHAGTERGGIAVVATAAVDGGVVGLSRRPPAARDVSCPGCVGSSDVSFNYAGSASQGGPASTALALNADAADCPTGFAPRGVDAQGTVVGCVDVGTQSELDAHTGDTAAHAATSSNAASRIVMRDVSGNFSAGTISATISGNASTAAALAADGANCTAGTAPLGVDAAGNVQACFDVATQSELDTHAADNTAHAATNTNVANRIVMRDASGNFSAGTISATLTGNAATASNLAANGTNCSAGNAPLGVDSAGAVESCFDVATQTELDTHANDTAAHSATNLATPNRIVRRDASGNFSAGTITANLTGTASDVACTGCVGTSDIADSSVTIAKIPGGSRVPVYSISGLCAGAGSITFASSCGTACCNQGSYNCYGYYSCGGACNAGSPQGCGNDFQGYLIR